MIAYGLGLLMVADLAYNLGSQSAIDGGDVPSQPGYETWIDNYDNPMRDNLGNRLYFNTNEAA